MDTIGHRIKLLLTIIILILIVFSAKLSIETLNNQNIAPLAFENLSKDAILEININNNSKESKIYQKENRWVTTKNDREYRADSDKVTEIINAFIKLQPNEIVSNNQNKRAMFGIGPQYIRIKTKSKTYVLYVGKNAGFDTTYVSIGESNDIFTAYNFSGILSTDEFRDLNPHLVNEDNNISKIILKKPIHTLILEKKNNDWFIKNKELKKERVDFLINDIKTLKANDIEPKKTDNRQSPPLFMTISLTENNHDTEISIVKKDQNTFLLTMTNSDLHYLIPAAYILALEKEEKDFIE